MATTRKTSRRVSVAPDPQQEAAERIRILNERLLLSYIAAGGATLDAYENTLKTIVAFQENVANTSQLEWVSSLAQAHAAFIRDTSAAYLQACRDLLD